VVPGRAGRYAPTPTGDLHVGNLRTALLAWLFARSTDRAFLLRIEDLDTSRVRPGIAERQVSDLRALGLDVDPPTLVQSERTDQYAAAIRRLADRTYECYCTRREIAEAASAPHGRQARYPGTCRDLTEVQRAERRRQRPAALRVRADAAQAAVTDLLHGGVSGVVDDFVVRRADGVAAYNLAVVVDDGASEVDQVVRGEDLLASAVNQAWLAGRLGLAAPVYAHVPLAVNRHGQRLAKRDGAVTRRELAPLGVDDARLLSLLAASLRLAEPGEPVTAGELLARFDPAGLPRDPWVVDPVRLAATAPAG
jgi:glutamyl-tRNA synthetase